MVADAGTGTGDAVGRNAVDRVNAIGADVRGSSIVDEVTSGLAYEGLVEVGAGDLTDPFVDLPVGGVEADVAVLKAIADEEKMRVAVEEVLGDLKITRNEGKRGGIDWRERE